MKIAEAVIVSRMEYLPSFFLSAIALVARPRRTLPHARDPAQI
jgi:hypothetical protein